MQIRQNKNTNSLFLCWNRYQRRTIELCRYFNITPFFISKSFGKSYFVLFNYFVQSLSTFGCLAKKQPDIIWVQMPPVPLLYIAFFYTTAFCRETILVADCHNSMIRPLWLKWPFVKPLLRRCSVVLVHNEEVRREALSLGLSPANLRVLGDRPADIDCSVLADASPVIERPHILFPSSFSDDEPIDEVLSAARLYPDALFYLTGDPRRAVGRHDLSCVPENVRVTGFVPEEEFNRLLCGASVVLALTKKEGIQLSACNEAIGAGRPLIVSGTSILRELFGKAALPLDGHDPKLIAETCRSAIANETRLASAMGAFRAEQMAKWDAKASEIARQYNRSEKNE